MARGAAQPRRPRSVVLPHCSLLPLVPGMALRVLAVVLAAVVAGVHCQATPTAGRVRTWAQTLAAQVL